MDGMEDYFRASLDLLDSSVRRELFQSDRPICTKAHDTPPALYAPGSAVKNSVMTAGSIIEGSVEIVCGTPEHPCVLAKGGVV